MIDEHRGWDWTRAGLWDGMGWDGMDGNQCAAEECEAKLWVLAAWLLSPARATEFAWSELRGCDVGGRFVACSC